MFDVVNVPWIISMVFDPKHKLNLLFTPCEMKFLTFKKNNIMALAGFYPGFSSRGGKYGYCRIKRGRQL